MSSVATAVVAGSVLGAGANYLGQKAAADQAGDIASDYGKSSKRAIADFMVAWEGDMPQEYQSERDYYYGDTRELNLAKALSKNDKKVLKTMDTIEKQNAFLSEKLGYPVELEQKIDYKVKKSGKLGKMQTFDEFGGKVKLKAVKTTIKPGYDPETDAAPGTFAALDDITAKGGTPSIAAQYQPWIKPGQDAYEAYTKAILGGDMTGFQEDPGTEYLRDQMRREADRLASSNRLPTSAAHQALIKEGGNLADQTFGNYLQRLSNLAQFGYNAFTDKETEQYAYKSGAANLQTGQAANVATLKGAATEPSAAAAGLNLLSTGLTTGVSAYQTNKLIEGLDQSGYN